LSSPVDRLAVAPLPRLIRAGILTGISDGIFASFLSTVVYGSTFSRLWQGVASVPLGPEALNGGSRTVAIGLLLHFGVAFTWSAIFLFLVLRSAKVREILASPWGVLKVAAVYGPFIWLVMSLVVIPLFTGRPPNITMRWWVQLIGHIPFVATPMLWAISRASPRRAGSLLALALLAVPSPPQQPLLRHLGAPEVEFSEPFSAVTSVRELRDGRLLVADARDKILHLVDLRAGTASKVGREGAGPGEYGMPQSLVALPADTTLLFDPMNGRLLLLLPDGTPGPVLRIEEPSPATRGPPRAADARGRFYYELSRPGEPGSPYHSSKADVVRYDRVTGRADILAALQLPEKLSTGARSLPGGMLQRFTNKPFASQDIAAFATDGRVAIVRARDYHVEWLGPDGKQVIGPATPYDRVRVTPAEREAFLKSQSRSAGSIIVRAPPGGASAPGAGAPRAAPIPRGSDPFDQPVEWPEYKPPFLAGAGWVAPDGRLWVLKTRAHDDPVPVYDIFDGGGHLVERIALPPSTRLAGFGRGVVYLARTDADDLLWLGRYRL
jgi:hypothetical protein